MPAYAYVVLAGGWLLWFIPFPLNHWNRTASEKSTALDATAKSDRRSRWGLVLQMIGYALLWQRHFGMKPPELWRAVFSVVFFALGVMLSWTSTRALGRHLRFDAAVSGDHQLVRSGPYRMLRHPIYTSMLCVLLGTGLMITSDLRFAVALVVFLAGTEIRVRIEDGLLASRFGDKFREYQRTVSAYIPFVR